MTQHKIGTKSFSTISNLVFLNKDKELIHLIH